MANWRNPNRLLGIGVVGTVVLAVCCFTPALVVVLAAIGLSSLVGAWLDLVLLPALAGFAGLTVLALVLRQRAQPKASGDEA